MDVDLPEQLKSVTGGKVEKQKGKIGKIGKRAPKLKYRSSTVVSETIPDFGYQQAQNRRWLELRLPKANRGDITKSILRELTIFFRCATVADLKRLPELTAASTAVVKGLEAERTRASILQGGTANPKDWFLSAAEEQSLVSLMSKASVTDDKEVEKEQRKLKKRRAKKQSKEQDLLRAKEIAQAGGPEAFEAAELMEGLEIEKSQQESKIHRQRAVPKVAGRVVERNQKMKKASQIRETRKRAKFIERKNREPEVAGAGALMEAGQVSRERDDQRLDVEKEGEK